MYFKVCEKEHDDLVEVEYLYGIFRISYSKVDDINFPFYVPELEIKILWISHFSLITLITLGKLYP